MCILFSKHNQVILLENETMRVHMRKVKIETINAAERTPKFGLWTETRSFSRICLPFSFFLMTIKLEKGIWICIF